MTTKEMINEYNQLHDKLEQRLRKLYYPKIKKCKEEKDIEGLRLMVKEVGEHHSFSIRFYQAMVEINNKK